MKLLIRAAIQNHKHYSLLILTMFAMLVLTLASQIEILAIGVISRTGPDFFVLFSEEKKGDHHVPDEVHKSTLEKKWAEISDNDVITKKQASTYLSRGKKKGLVYRVNAFLDQHFHLAKSLVRLALVVVVVAFFKAGALFCYRYFTQVVAIRVSRDLRQRCFEHVQNLSMNFYHSYDMAQISSRVSGDAGVVAASVNALLINYIQTPFAILSTFCALLLISWKLTLLVFIGVPLIIVPVVFISRRIKEIAQRMQTNHEMCTRVLMEYICGIFTIKTFSMEKFSLKKFRENNFLMAKLEEKSARYGLAARPILHLISSVFFASVILSGLYWFEIAPEELLVYCGLLYVFYEPVKKFAEENIQIQRGVVAAERMFSLLAEIPKVRDLPQAEPLTNFQHEIEFCNVSFRYKDEWVLKNLSFKVPKGQIVAIVGPTGAGKSTIVSLLPRLYDLDEGEILIDGKPLPTYTQESLRKHIAFVPQRPFLFLDSIQENISIGRSYSQEEIITASRNAHAEEFIVRMPGSYQTVLQELGKNLSGGQQQRLAIARALVTKAPILVMDEATSSLDAVSEEKIRDAILDMRGKLTQIIIAHRFSTIEHADKIIYLDHGVKIAEGTKEQLLASCPEFRQMWELMHLNSENANAYV
ncbi:MAG: ABC transporter ATP-binding protein [Verrucomicrobia bacterium]|nr:ABC transporter ATP-binding protein [Verrucomicrobiota bacterium]MBS0645014.1 ABC transporter ATP-binding protein [Verrucomicrobiota bacterium]